MEKIEKLLSPFQIDLRTLGLFRILFGLLLFRDLIDRILHLNVFYSDWGVLPRHVLLSEQTSSTIWSVFFASGSAIQSGLLLGILGVFIILFTLGLKTRISNFFIWILLTSLHARFPLANHGGDDLIRVCLFWSMLLPTNAYFSLDSQFSHGTKELPHRLTQFATMAFLGQLAYMYIFTGLLKWHPIWHTEGSAIWLAIQLDQFAKPFGVLLRSLPFEVTRFMTITILWFELIAPILVFSPWKRQFFRTWIPLLFIGFHFGLFISFEINLFPWTCMIYWVAFLPEALWTKFPTLENRINQLIDSAAGLVKFISPHRPQLRYSNLMMAFIVACFGVITYWNVATLNDHDDIKITGPLRTIASTLRISQKWNMFAPYPKRYSGWMVTDGVLNDGSSWDPFRDTAVNYDKPEDVVGSYRDGIWRKYLGNLVDAGNDTNRLYLGKWICRQWNESHSGDKKLQTFKLYYVNTRTQRPSENNGQPFEQRRTLLWSHYCFKKPDHFN